MLETEKIIRKNLDFLPLRTSAHIIEGNALRMNWEDVVSKEKLDYIIGNPPFIGASVMSAEQKAEAVAIFGKGKRVNSIDYVGAWYYKAAEYMQETDIKATFVSTNSITQGEQVAPLWGKLLNNYHLNIIFAYKTFKWMSEAVEKAAVHCVIIGFCIGEYTKAKYIYEKEIREEVKNISPYLVNASNILVESSASSICNKLRMTAGNKPSDGGNLILSQDERDELAKDPKITICIRRYIGSQDFINDGKKRYCLWLKGISSTVYQHNTEICRRLEAVRKMRLDSSAAPTKELANKPYLFFSTPQTENTYLAIPEISSERRRYIPMGFMDSSIIASNKLLIVPDATIYYFGILTSNVHMAWVRTVAGRLKSDYQYSAAIVYNNFPWPSPSDKQKEKIEKTAQAILDARTKYPKISLAKMYTSMYLYPELLKAHEENDKAVMEAYGFSKDMTEPEIVSELMKMYQVLDAAEKQKKQAIENKKKSSRKNKM